MNKILKAILTAILATAIGVFTFYTATMDTPKQEQESINYFEVMAKNQAIEEIKQDKQNEE